MRYLISILIFVSGLSASAKSDDKYDVRFNALGFAFGAFVADLNIAIDSNWTLGPQLGVLHYRIGRDAGFTDDYDVKAYTLGLRANWFHNGNFTDGLYVGPSAKWASAKVTTSDSTGPITQSSSATLLSCVVGYGWFWNTFNIMLGGGLTVGLGDSNVKVTNSTGTSATVATNVSAFATEVALGWTF